MPNTYADNATLVIGLGRFGSAIAVTLDKLDKEILAVETNSDLAQQWSHRFNVVEADARSAEALHQLGAEDFGVAVVGVGALEASVLITANLVDIGVPDIWAKATSREHGTILKRIGAHHVVYPEYDAGQRVAHMLSGRMLDYIEMEDQFTIVKMVPPRDLVGFSLAESNVRERFGVTVIGVKSPGQPFEYASPETTIGNGDVLIVSGEPSLLEAFANRFVGRPR
ncbi:MULTISPECIES: potassium channel family protein [Trueperella]|uniref:Ktr system potassium uptake protein A n=1 Tax=Trueperella bernardiae TaxID=59561 RepID=A0A0W1KKE3_9ACTO|nr:MULTISPECIES: TrkA family potassium uptake protein [Trueperella]KTF04278.1 Ktr system potassium uptake protein A [Trueperella bernardiae]MCM3906718.1 TrkA family potassium uptake protein [Trueperella bernardiae]MDK8601454.1 TrkA family potassium uptake protein [Trueperella bernardiae]MDV6238139.1 TrkA family potassium uptake protein [Trueperella bernardiae]OCW60709.1 potassium transporter [Trueperella bernardiae]